MTVHSEHGVVPPPTVAEAARKCLELHEKFNRGATSVGLRRGRQLAERRPVSWRDIVAISAYFARHSVDRNTKSHVWGDENNPSPGYVAWLLWGGDPGREWADGMKARAEGAPLASATRPSLTR